MARKTENLLAAGLTSYDRESSLTDSHLAPWPLAASIEAFSLLEPLTQTRGENGENATELSHSSFRSDKDIVVFGSFAEEDGLTYFGTGGNDTIIGGSWADSIYAKSGADFLDGGSGLDELYGEAGNDDVRGGSGADGVYGGDGDDLLTGGADNDILVGGAGQDTALYKDAAGGVTVDLLTNGNGGSHAKGDELSLIENLVGSSGFDDVLSGDNGANSLYGLSGNDHLVGRDGADLLDGDVGNDTLEGGSGADRIIGGAGRDTASYAASLAAVAINLGDGLSESGNDAKGDELTGIEDVWGGAGNDVLTGDAGDNLLYGRDGNDTLDGGGGIDSLHGGSGNDVVFWDSADSQLSGGSGLDTIIGTTGKDVIGLANEAKFSANPFEAAADHHSFEVFYLEDGNDTIFGATQATAFQTLDSFGLLVYGGAGNDSLQMKWATTSPTTNNDDTLFGGDGADDLRGVYGNDTLFGDSGNDLLIGGKGDDTMDGGVGDDAYYIGRDEGVDRIIDNSGPNGLVLFAGFQSNSYGAGGNSFNGVDPTEVSILYGATDVTIFIDSDDDGIFTDETSYVSFAKGQIGTILTIDYANNDTGNGTVIPPTQGAARDIWQATWNGTSFDPWVLTQDG